MINYNSILYIPANSKIIIEKSDKLDISKKITVFDTNKKFIFWFNGCVKFDKWGNCLQLINSNIKDSFNTVNNVMNRFVKSWNFFFFEKIKFKGKGFRIKFFKKTKLIKFYFGRSHKTFMLLKTVKRKRINKYKFILFALSKEMVKGVSSKITNIKKMNFYTLRGLRISRQIIYKRKGKKGTYI